MLSEVEHRIVRHKETFDRRAPEVPSRYSKLYPKVVNGPAKPSRNNAIRVMCMECMGWDKAEVERCVSTACPLWQNRPFKSETSKLVEIGIRAAAPSHSLASKSH